ncbi:tyrosine-type recombinase/integrase [Natribacillus halophilus]|uniref:Site-specific recombinase XerD n=1 Tax=Natribacillus halophilus TaxID=549003 RepID=A0A1G8PT70_9BACI|nr:tyrosine-type recombinase/integrase [Natribacillus halophilus]SDI95653.1 Site-specific recombinase XerD [Natribacillus halophilus]
MNPEVRGRKPEAGKGGMGLIPQKEKLPTEALEFLEFLISRGRKSSTIRRYAYDLADFYSFAAIHADRKVTNLHPVEAIILEDYFTYLMETRAYNRKTTKRIAAVLRRYFLFLSQTHGHTTTNLMRNVQLPPAADEAISKDDLLTQNDLTRLFQSLDSDLGLSEEQRQARPLLAPRNKAMIQLLLHHGLRLQELHSLSLDDVNFGTGTISISPTDSEVQARVLRLSKSDRRDLNRYIKVIPKPVRPYPGERHPLFVAFDFQKQTYRWSYENDEPKRLTIVAMQKMIREEARRAGLPPGKSARHFRHTYIVSALRRGHSLEAIQETLGLHSPLVLFRYQDYVNEHT